jgi:hypothetical protein
LSYTFFVNEEESADEWLGIDFLGKKLNLAPKSPSLVGK